ncbi:uncharacterized protein [Physcomitrium patens]|uniref:uncharacterized protein n=1 Tax=Physcomitrium patens TaxID=3218 RepID=UPI003CCCFF3D
MSDKWPLDRSLIPVCGLSGIGAQIRRSLPCEKGQSHQSEGRASWWINCLKTHYYDAAAYQMIGPWGGGFDFRESVRRSWTRKRDFKSHRVALPPAEARFADGSKT